MAGGRKKGARVTLLDVAEAAGVSRATASLVVRRSSRVGAETRKRVEAAMRRLGYVYNLGAASMRAARSNTVGVIVPNLGNPFFAELLEGVEAVLDKAGLVVVMANSQESAEKQNIFIQRMRERSVDGVIVCPAAQTAASLPGDAAGWGLPFVQVLRHVSMDQADYAGTDYAGGVQQAVSHLVALGHRQIAFVAGGAEHSARAERLKGFRAAMTENGLDAGMVMDVPLGPAIAPEKVEELLRHPGKPTAAICFNDVVAAALSSGLWDRGLQVGKDFSVVGFDDLAEAELIRPRLTSVATFPSEIGDAAARLLLDRLEDPERNVRRSISVTRLITRQSTAPVPEISPVSLLR